MPSNIYSKEWYHQDINPLKKTKAEEKEIVCHGCGNPDVFTNQKCFYCKRIFRGIGLTPPHDYEYELKTMEELARLRVPYLPIGGRFIDDKEDEYPEENHPLQSRETIINRLFKKWKAVL